MFIRLAGMKRVFISPRLIQLPHKNFRIKVLNDSAFLSIFQSSTDSGKTVLFFFEPPESGTYHFAGVIITPSGNVGTDKLLKMRPQSNSYSSWHKQSIYTLKCKNKSYIIQIRKIRVKTARNIRTSERVTTQVPDSLTAATYRELRLPPRRTENGLLLYARLL